MNRNFAPACGLALLLGGWTSGASATDWNGIYGGVVAGWNWADVSVLDDAGDSGVEPGPFDYSADGVFGGVTAGYNWQLGNTVLGVEGEFGYMNLSGAGVIPSSNPSFSQDATLRGGVYGDLTGRAGYAFGDTLVYGKGGFSFFTGEAKQQSTNPLYAGTGTGTFTGWIAGAGIEHYVSPRMSIGVEYQHRELGPEVGFQTALVDDPPTPAGYQFHNWTTVVSNSVTFSLKWHFDPAP